MNEIFFLSFLSWLDPSSRPNGAIDIGFICDLSQGMEVLHCSSSNVNLTVRCECMLSL